MSGSSQAGDEARSAESLQNKMQRKSKRRRCDRKTPLSCLQHFYNIPVMNAGVPCFALHRLPGNCRHYVTFLRRRDTKTPSFYGIKGMRDCRDVIYRVLNRN